VTALRAKFIRLMLWSRSLQPKPLLRAREPPRCSRPAEQRDELASPQEFSRSRFLADPLTRHPPKPVCLDFDVRLHQSVGMSGVGMSRARV